MCVSAGLLLAGGHIELGRVASCAGDPPPGSIVLMCCHGERAMSAAGMLLRAGHHDVVVLVGGPQERLESTGQPLEVAS